MGSSSSFHNELKELLSLFTADILKAQPTNIKQYAAHYFGKLYLSSKEKAVPAPGAGNYLATDAEDWGKTIYYKNVMRCIPFNLRRAARYYFQGLNVF